jgi:diguanylate cyclase (GGDEF)-like protein
MATSHKVHSVKYRSLAGTAVACGVMLLLTVGAVLAQLQAVERGAEVEASHIGRAMSYGINNSHQPVAVFLQGWSHMSRRDFTVVDSQGTHLASIGHHASVAAPDFLAAAQAVIAQVLRDGKPRPFVETVPGEADRIHMVTPWFRQNDQARADTTVPPQGVILVEYSNIRHDLREASQPTLLATGVAGLLCTLLLAITGVYIARSNTRSAEEIEHIAYHDRLTGLPNRSLFNLVLSQRLRHVRRYGGPLAVFFIDLDRFKFINDTLGHAAGDQLLRTVAQRLQNSLRESDTVARLGGDEFVVLLPHFDHQDYLRTVALKLLHTLREPIVLQGSTFHVSGSIGIAAFPGDGMDEPSLMKHADIAMYQAKERGKNHFAFYSEDMNRHSVERLAFEAALRQAFEQHKIELHYQPKIDLHTRRIRGVEALLRWQHPDLGDVPPIKFLPVAEDTGMIVPLGHWVLRTACAQQVSWCRAGLPAVPMAINLSARQFADKGLVEMICGVLAETGIQPNCLELEVTESTLVRDLPHARHILQALHNLGIRLSIDDFGTGYSTLAHLKGLPIDTIKVDRSFIQGITNSDDDRAIADAIISVGKTLHKTVVAEGVETQAQATLLTDRGCDELQGFFFSKAVPASEVTALLRADVKSAPSGNVGEPHLTRV